MPPGHRHRRPPACGPRKARAGSLTAVGDEAQSRERYLHEVVLASFPILDYDRAAAEWHALERARLSALGMIPPFIDGQIAAIARVNDLTLVTSNKADFRGFKGLRVSSWT